MKKGNFTKRRYFLIELGFMNTYKYDMDNLEILIKYAESLNMTQFLICEYEKQLNIIKEKVDYLNSIISKLPEKDRVFLINYYVKHKKGNVYKSSRAITYRAQDIGDRLEDLIEMSKLRYNNLH